MPDADKTIEMVRSMLRNNRADLMGFVDVAERTGWNDECLNANHRATAQVDAMFKSKCEDYEPPEHEVGSTFINAGIMSDEVAAMLSQSNGGKKKGWRGMLTAILGTLAAVALGAGLMFAAAKFFGDDTDTKYQITALPYVPPQGGDAP